jgi:tetratricopeptide (TPR) repeat protein
VNNANRKSILLICTFLFFLWGCLGITARAAESILVGGDAAMLEAPHAGFFDELCRLVPAHGKFRAHPATNYASEAAEADLAELNRSLQKTNVPAALRLDIVKRFAAERAKLTDFRERLEAWNPDPLCEWVDGNWVTNAAEPRPTPDALDPAALDGVPAEFVDYLQGSLAWYALQTNDARGFWETLLNRPAPDRHYRSTWAAYMLGKSWALEDPDKATAYFQEVRALRGAGFADRIGLAAASLGEEGRVALRQKQFANAFSLYLTQLAGGDDTAASSLRFVCRDLMNNPEQFSALAAVKPIRQVVNAYLVADSYSFDNTYSNRMDWLGAIKEDEVHDANSMEQLALLAYQTQQWNTARYWIGRDPDSPTAQWLLSKLLLREGKPPEALSILERIVDQFPTNICSEHLPAGAGLESHLYCTYQYSCSGLQAHAHIQQEIGALWMARENYFGALDQFLAAGSWTDAAYVAERVLRVDELKNYVDNNWPPAPPETNATDFDARLNIRWLLARRLADAGDFDSARPYYPDEMRTNFDEWVGAMDDTSKTDLPREEKIAAFLRASDILATNGFNLVGTEMWPDWRQWGSDNDTKFFDNRQQSNQSIIGTTQDEIERTRHGVNPALRSHYEYQAAGLALEAAKLMPDNSVEKARLYCRAGGLIKSRDPKAADYFYKSLVRQCRQTDIGALADRKRWFPELDENGNPVPWKPAAPVPTNGPPDKAGYWYVLNRGNTLQDVVDVLDQTYHVVTTVAAVREANPTLNPNRLRAGLTVFVPLQN